MKKLFVAAVAAVALSTSAFAETTKTGQDGWEDFNSGVMGVVVSYSVYTSEIKMADARKLVMASLFKSVRKDDSAKVTSKEKMHSNAMEKIIVQRNKVFGDKAEFLHFD